MTLNIIHLPYRKDRMELLNNELIEQEISDYRIWNGIIDSEMPFRGISRAHKQIVAWAKDQKYEQVMIAEDDIRFTAKGAFSHFLINEPKDYDLYLAGTYFGEIQEDNSINDFSGTMLYIIRRRFYDCFLSLPEKTNFDRELANKGKYFVCNPFTAIQHPGYSDNRKATVSFDRYLKGRKLFGQS
jgi:hypothetical protein